jgi:16S rRNA (adenine1518-N6/adenine1519-N6)-dimethyltransferase
VGIAELASGAPQIEGGKVHTAPKKLLREHGIRPRKGLGQNFLVDPAALKRIVAAADLSSGDIVLEVGPGLGGLTRLLAAEAGHVVAVELDAQLAEALREILGDLSNVTIVYGDILALSPAALIADATRRCTGEATLRPYAAGFQYKVVANLPYYITSAILRHLLEATYPPQVTVITVQREVAQRILASPGDMSLLAVSVQFYGQPRMVARIPAGAFYPTPKVDSAIVRIDRHERPPVDIEDVAGFFQVVRAGFGQRRKQLHNALAAGLELPGREVEMALERAGIERRRRAETLSLTEWGALYRAFRKVGVPARQEA